ncbi:amidase signature domain-containing protein [Podospora conica]|nr:amidase signature domain-containing protein [Schizothecium conicum]
MRTGSRLRTLCLRCPRSHGVTLGFQQRRLLNHFISKGTPPPLSQEIPSDLPKGAFTLAVKDNIATESLPTTCASAFLAPYTSPFEATIVTQLRQRGAVVVGKTNLDEFGMGSHSTHSAFGPVTQPDSNLSPGGSSGGSAVAVATGEAALALGTDTGGSVRLPAAYTGVVGYKPSYGMLSRHGVIPYANSLDTVGLLSRTVTSLQHLLLSAPTPLWSEHDPLDPTSLPPSTRRRCAALRQGYTPSAPLPTTPLLPTLTIGLPLEYNPAELDPRIRAAWAAAASALAAAHATIVPVSLPSTRHALPAYYVLAPAEASSNLAKYDGVRYGSRSTAASDYAASRAAGFGAEVQRRILLGAYTLSAEAMDNYFLQAQRVRRVVRRDFDRVFRLGNPLVDGEVEGPFDLSDVPEGVEMQSKLGPAQVDFLLCPTAPTLAPRADEVRDGLEGYVNDVFTVPASLAGLPAVSVPLGVEGDGRWAGLQVVGQFWDDARLLAVAREIPTPSSSRL